MSKFIIAILIFISAGLSAVELPKLTVKENERSLQWLEQNQADSHEYVLMKALVSLHYQPTSTLMSYRSVELEDNKRRLILNLLLDQCEQIPKNLGCDEGSLESELIELDPRNLIPYLFQFRHFLAKGDLKSALSSLKVGLKATEANDYSVEQEIHLRRELKSIGFRGGRANLAAHYYVAGMPQIYLKIIPACVEQAKISQEWKSVCLALTPILERGTSFLANVVGAALERDVLKATSSDEKKIQAAVEHRALYNEIRADARSIFPRFWDPTQRPDSYYRNAAKFGELQAFKMMIDQVSGSVSFSTKWNKL